MNQPLANGLVLMLPLSSLLEWDPDWTLYRTQKGSTVRPSVYINYTYTVSETNLNIHSINRLHGKENNSISLGCLQINILCFTVHWNFGLTIHGGTFPDAHEVSLFFFKYWIKFPAALWFWEIENKRKKTRFNPKTDHNGVKVITKCCIWMQLI